MDQKRMRKRAEKLGYEWLHREPYYNRWQLKDQSGEIKLFKTLAEMDKFLKEKGK